MIVYHGSNVEIDEIDLSKGNKYKDFGQGFYVTTIKEQALNMAKKVARRVGGQPVVTIFEFDEGKSKELHVKKFNYPNKDWALMIINNRNSDFCDYSEELSNHDNKYDIVYGPIANDKIAATFELYVEGFYDINDVIKRFKYNKLNNQYSFHTQKSLELLTKVGVINEKK